MNICAKVAGINLKSNKSFPTILFLRVCDAGKPSKNLFPPRRLCLKAAGGT